MSIAKQKTWPLNTTVLLLLMLTAVWLASNLMSGNAAARIQNVGAPALYENLDLKYLVEHIEAFKSTGVKVNGTVRYYASIYMFEDLWLQAGEGAKIPVVTRFAGLPRPPEGIFIEVSGTIEYCNLEGGFYFLNATSWSAIQQTQQPTLSPTSPPPSPTIEPTNSPNQEEDTPPSGSEPLATQPISGNIWLFEYAILATVAIVAIAMFSTYLFYYRKKQLKAS
ncbi:MAG: hypothetical protein QXD70_02380 [Candidatus Bathyarchaeia archaeon]